MTKASNFDDERYVTVKRLVELPAYRGWLTEAAVRHLIFASRERLNSRGDVNPSNGLNRAVLRIGRKVLIDLVEWETWLASHREQD